MGSLHAGKSCSLLRGRCSRWAGMSCSRSCSLLLAGAGGEMVCGESRQIARTSPDTGTFGVVHVRYNIVMKSKSAISKANWRARNPEKVAEQAARQREVQRNKVPQQKPDYAAAKAAYRLRYPDRAKAQSQAARVTRKANVALHLWLKAKERCKRSGVMFVIAVSDITVPAVCPVMGIPMTVGGARDNSPSLDRIDPSRGYVPGNVCVICYRANRIKPMPPWTICADWLPTSKSSARTSPANR